MINVQVRINTKLQIAGTICLSYSTFSAGHPSVLTYIAVVSAVSPGKLLNNSFYLDTTFQLKS